MPRKSLTVPQGFASYIYQAIIRQSVLCDVIVMNITEILDWIFTGCDRLVACSLPVILIEHSTVEHLRERLIRATVLILDTV